MLNLLRYPFLVSSALKTRWSPETWMRRVEKTNNERHRGVIAVRKGPKKGMWMVVCRECFEIKETWERRRLRPAPL
jgi:hypothetical protein